MTPRLLSKGFRHFIEQWHYSGMNEAEDRRDLSKRPVRVRIGKLVAGDWFPVAEEHPGHLAITQTFNELPAGLSQVFERQPAEIRMIFLYAIQQPVPNIRCASGELQVAETAAARARVTWSYGNTATAYRNN
jgi:hypothetical protein